MLSSKFTAAQAAQKLLRRIAQRHAMVHCRTGSSEKTAELRRCLWTVHCRTGSSENIHAV